MKKAAVLTIIVLFLLVFAPCILRGLDVERALASEAGTPLSVEAYPAILFPMIRTEGSQFKPVPTKPPLP
jgi:hypothetical protein